MVLPDKYAGQHVQCPGCQAMLRIPTEDEDRELMRWYCTCGQRLKARARSAGLTVACPRCKVETTVPLIDKHEAFIEDKFALDESSGIVQLAPPGAVEVPASDVRMEDEESVMAEDSSELESDITESDVYDLNSRLEIEREEGPLPSSSQSPAADKASSPLDSAEDESGSDLLTLGATGK